MATPSPAPETPSPVRSGRRRQRSVRVTVAVCLLSLATAAVLLALPTRSPAWLSTAALLSLACGWAAARIVYSELVQSRREAAADRARQAQELTVRMGELEEALVIRQAEQVDELASWGEGLSVQHA